MSLSNIAFASGLSSLMIVVIGWVLGLYLFKRYLSDKDNKNTLALAILLMSIGSVWLSISVNFILALMGNEFLNELPYILIIGWIPGVVLISVGYMFISIVKEEYLKLVMFVTFAIFVINLIIVYGLILFGYFPISDQISFVTPVNGLPDASTTGFFQILTITSIIFMAITSIFFIYTSFKTTIPIVKTRARLLGVGLLLSSVTIIFDSVLPPENITLLLGIRLIIVFSLFILAMGITLPKRIFKNLT